MNGKYVLIIAFIVSIAAAGAVQARPEYGVNCGGCHATTTGRFEVTSHDTTLNLGTQLDGSVRGALKTFVVSPGTTKTLWVNVTNAGGYLVLSGLEKGGQKISLSNHLSYTPDATWTQQGTTDPYFTRSAPWTGTYSFNLTVNAATPDDVYDLTFAMAGRQTGAGLWYQQEHFYVQVVSTPAVQPLAVVNPNGSEVLNAGDNYAITWQGGANDDLIDVDYSDDNGTTWASIATGLANTGSYTWLVPAVSTTQALVRVSSASDSDVSDATFTIVWTPPSPAISGVITNSDGGMSLAGVSVSANNGGGSGVTDASGNYSLTVAYNWSGVVTPSKAGYTFAPVSRTYSNVTTNQANQDYVGTLTPLPSSTISGVVTASDTTPLAGVSVSANNGGGSGVTDASGNYSLTVAYNWSGVVTSSKAGYTFAPVSRTYSNVTTNQANQDYVGTLSPLPSPTISGVVTASDTTPLAGVSVSANNGGGSGVTDASGNYSLTVGYNWSGVVTPSKAGYTFAPVSRTYSNVTTNQANQDYVGSAAASVETIIIDNDDAGTSSAARWQRVSGGGAYDGDARYCRKRDGIYTFWTALTGTYEVSMWWPSGPDNLAVAPVLILDGDELLDRVLVDQGHNGSQWNLLGTYEFRTEARVIIDSIGSGALVCADAVRFVASSSPTVPGPDDGGVLDHPDYDD